MFSNNNDMFGTSCLMNVTVGLVEGVFFFYLSHIPLRPTPCVNMFLGWIE